MAEALSQPERSSSPHRRPGDIFVGRQRELAELSAAREDALSGCGRLVMLAGEPGIGKTRTAQELASLAESRGAQVLWGRCYEENGAPPYWPWVQVIRAYVQQAGAEQLAAEMGTGAADIAEIVSELTDKLPGLETHPTIDPEQDRFRLFASITNFFKTASQSRPLILVLDDVHWADQSSLQLLECISREIMGSPLLVIGAYRDVELSRRHPLSETLAQLSRLPEGGYQRVLLRGLDQENTARFLLAGTGIEPAPGLVEALYAQTEGNPFFMTEVIRLLSDSGELTASRTGTPEGLRIPESVREVIGRRLNRLSDECNEVLTTASIIGREFDFRLLNTLIGGMSEDQLLQLVEEAVFSHLIEDVPGQLDRYQFVHAIFQQTLAEEVTTSRGVRLHARIGEALEDLYGDDAEVHSAELAHHFAEAQTSIGPQKLVQYSLLAGERALAAHAYEEALGHFERGLAGRSIALSGTETASDEEAADLLFGLARARSATFERHQAAEVFASLSRAFDYYAKAGKVDLAVAVAGSPVSRHSTEMGRLIDRALAMVAPDSHEAGRLLSRYGGVLGSTEGQYDGAREAFSRALTIARHEGDETLEMQTLAEAASLAYVHLRHEESFQRSVSVIELARRIDDPRTEVFARFHAVGANYTRGNLEEAVRQATEALPVAETLRDRYLLSRVLWMNSSVYHLAGDWRTAREFSDRGLAESGQSSVILGTRVLLEYEIGEFEQGEAYLNRLLEAMGLVSPAVIDYAFPTVVLPLVDRITGDAKWTDVAAESAERVAAAASSPLPILAAKTALGLVAALRGDADSAGEQYQFLQQYRGMVVPGLLLSVDRLLGLLSQTMGNLDQSGVHFEDALVFCGKAGYRPELAWTCHDYASCLLARGKPGDGYRAMTLLNQSVGITFDLGMSPLMERAAALKSQIESGPEPDPVPPDGLTSREVEVLRHIANGRSSRDVAEELVLSIRTVERHITNIYRKIKARGRADATAYALGHGLLSQK